MLTSNPVELPASISCLATSTCWHRIAVRRGVSLMVRISWTTLGFAPDCSRTWQMAVAPTMAQWWSGEGMSMVCLVTKLGHEKYLGRSNTGSKIAFCQVKIKNISSNEYLDFKMST